MNCNTELGKFCYLHPNWEELLTKPPYNLIIKRDADYVLFKYNQLDSDFSNSIVKEARGIIFKEGSWEAPVCHPFDKFFNYGEPFCDTIDWETACVTEKIDGSLIKLWYDENGWHVSTNGTIDAGKAEVATGKTFLQLFIQTLERLNINFDRTFKSLQTTDSTFMFELTTPENVVVVPHSVYNLYYLGSRNNITGKEYSFNYGVLSEIFETPKTYNLRSLEEVQKSSQELPWDEEGYVVVDSSFHRCKIKSPSYVRAHYICGNNVITKKRLLDIILANEIFEFTLYTSDYGRTAINSVVHEMDMFKKGCNDSWEQLTQLKRDFKKTYANRVKNFDSKFAPFLFAQIGPDIKVEDFTHDWTSDKWLKVIGEELEV